MSTTPPETDRNVTAFFDSRETAEQAVTKLIDTGLSRDRILLRAGAARKAAYVDDGKGLLQEVKELILPSEEPDSAVAALKHEGFLLSVRPNADSHDDVFALLEREGGRGVESREDIWPDWKTGQDRSVSGVDPDLADAADEERPEPADEERPEEAAGPDAREHDEPNPSPPADGRPTPSAKPPD